MKIPALFVRAGLLASLAFMVVTAAVLETNLEPQSATAVAPAPVIVPGLEEMRDQLRTMQLSNEEMHRSSKEAVERWNAMVQQNSALSNVLTGLQQTLVTQKEREIKLAEQSNSLTTKVIGGAAVAVFL